jgi:hypothetical protein
VISPKQTLHRWGLAEVWSGLRHPHVRIMARFVQSCHEISRMVTICGGAKGVAHSSSRTVGCAGDVVCPGRWQTSRRNLFGGTQISGKLPGMAAGPTSGRSDAGRQTPLPLARQQGNTTANAPFLWGEMVVSHGISVNQHAEKHLLANDAPPARLEFHSHQLAALLCPWPGVVPSDRHDPGRLTGPRTIGHHENRARSAATIPEWRPLETRRRPGERRWALGDGRQVPIRIDMTGPNTATTSAAPSNIVFRRVASPEAGAEGPLDPQWLCMCGSACQLRPQRGTALAAATMLHWGTIAPCTVGGRQPNSACFQLAVASWAFLKPQNIWKVRDSTYPSVQCFGATRGTSFTKGSVKHFGDDNPCVQTVSVWVVFPPPLLG